MTKKEGFQFLEEEIDMEKFFSKIEGMIYELKVLILFEILFIFGSNERKEKIKCLRRKMNWNSIIRNCSW